MKCLECGLPRFQHASADCDHRFIILIDSDAQEANTVAELQEVANELARQRREHEEGADAPLHCPDCDEVTNDGERCGECLSERAGYYVEGGQG